MNTRAKIAMATGLVALATGAWAVQLRDMGVFGAGRDAEGVRVQDEDGAVERSADAARPLVGSLAVDGPGDSEAPSDDGDPAEGSTTEPLMQTPANETLPPAVGVDGLGENFAGVGERGGVDRLLQELAAPGGADRLGSGMDGVPPDVSAIRAFVSEARVSAIIRGERTRVAVLDDRVVRPGDRVFAGRLEVLDVTGDGVRVGAHGRDWVVTLRDLPRPPAGEDRAVSGPEGLEQGDED